LELSGGAVTGIASLIGVDDTPAGTDEIDE
jgi:hypothetical protein